MFNKAVSHAKNHFRLWHKMEYNDPPIFNSAAEPAAEPAAKPVVEAEPNAESDGCFCMAGNVCRQNAPLLTCVATSACMYACLPLALSAFAAGTYLGGVLDYATAWGFQTVHNTWPPLRNNLEQLRHKIKRE